MDSCSFPETFTDEFFLLQETSDINMITRPNIKPFDYIMTHITRLSVISKQPKPFVFGGYVRDTLLGKPIQEINDFDIMASYDTIKRFIRFLAKSERLLGIQRCVIKANTSEYPLFKILVETPGNIQVKVDLVINGSNPIHQVCDFTCNNLIMYDDNTINIRVKPSHKNMDDKNYLAICLNDLYSKTLNCMWFPRPELLNWRGTDQPYLINQLEIRKRLQKMIEMGFNTPPNLSISSQFPFLPADATYCIKPDQSCNDLSCKLCGSPYNENTIHNTILCKCGYHFHVDCLYKQLTSNAYNANKRCPSCKKLSFTSYLEASSIYKDGVLIEDETKEGSSSSSDDSFKRPFKRTKLNDDRAAEEQEKRNLSRCPLLSNSYCKIAILSEVIDMTLKLVSDEDLNTVHINITKTNGDELKFQLVLNYLSNKLNIVPQLLSNEFDPSYVDEISRTNMADTDHNSINTLTDYVKSEIAEIKRDIQEMKEEEEDEDDLTEIILNAQGTSANWYIDNTLPS